VITTKRLMEALNLTKSGLGYFESKELMETLVAESLEHDSLRPPCVCHENRTYTLDKVEEAVFSALTGHITTEGNYALIKAFSKLRNPTPKCPHCGQDITKEGAGA